MAIKKQYGVAIIAAIVIVAVAAVALFGYASAQSSRTNLAVQLTDPPFVPAGTSALVITYSSVQLHPSSSPAGSGWITSSSGGSVDLMSLQNLSQTVATFALAANTTVNQVRFNVTSATITINGTTYSVLLSNSTIQASVNARASANSTSASSILVDLSPTVVAIYTANSTVFVMVPSVRAVVVPGLGRAYLHVGARSSLGQPAKAAISFEARQISLSGAALSQNGNTTTLSVTVTDTSNSSVVLRNLMLSGPQMVRVRVGSNVIVPQVPPTTVNASGYGNISTGGSDAHWIIIANGSVQSGGDANTSSNVTFETHASSGLSNGNAQVRVGSMIAFLRTIDFIVLSNGTLALPYSASGTNCIRATPLSANASATAALPGVSTGAGAYANSAVYCPYRYYNSSGYTLQPGQSITLSFTGTIGTAFPGIYNCPNAASGAACGGFMAGIVPGDTYQIAVTGSGGAFATANVVATGSIAAT